MQCEEVLSELQVTVFIYQMVIAGLGLISLITIISAILISCYFKKKLQKAKKATGVSTMH